VVNPSLPSLSPPSPLGSYLGKSGTYPGKFENIRTNLKMKTFFPSEIKLILCKKSGKF